MQCEKCNAQLDPKFTACPECGAPVPQNIEGFENTMEFQKELRSIVVNYGARAVMNKDRFIGLLSDHIPDYDKERRLLINMYRMGVLKILLEDKNREIAVMKAKSFMLGDLFLAENASEFVVACYTYLLGWPYESHLRKRSPRPRKNQRISTRWYSCRVMPSSTGSAETSPSPTDIQSWKPSASTSSVPSGPSSFPLLCLLSVSMHSRPASA